MARCEDLSCGTDDAWPACGAGCVCACHDKLSDYLASRGYELVAPECPECNFGQLVRTPHGYVRCTAYGQCELAPG